METAPHILVVDDEPRFCKLLQGFLLTDGHKVELANDGREGLQKFLSGHFDVVIADQAMPEMSGTQLASSIKRIVADKPVVLLTGFSDSIVDHPQSVEEIMGKPVILKQLRQMLARVTEGT